MPFKANHDRRHHIPKQRHRVTNWAVYDAGLRARGSLTVWFTTEAIEAWRAEPRTGRGGQPRYSSLAIISFLTRIAFVTGCAVGLATPIAQAQTELPPNWWTPLLSSDGSGKVSNESGTASFYG